MPQGCQPSPWRTAVGSTAKIATNRSVVALRAGFGLWSARRPFGLFVWSRERAPAGDDVKVGGSEDPAVAAEEEASPDASAAACRGARSAAIISSRCFRRSVIFSACTSISRFCSGGVLTLSRLLGALHDPVQSTRLVRTRAYP